MGVICPACVVMRQKEVMAAVGTHAILGWTMPRVIPPYRLEIWQLPVF
jgi:hypothetical protein